MSLSLDRYAEIAALIRHFAPNRAEVLARASVSPEEYDESDRHWRRTFSESIEQEDNRAISSFGLRFAEVRRAWRLSGAPIETIGDLREVAAAPKPALDSPVGSPEESGRREGPAATRAPESVRLDPGHQLPSFLLPQQAPVPPVAPRPPSRHDELGNVTGAMPAPIDLHRMIAEAEPSVAMARAPRVAGGGAPIEGRGAGPLRDEDALGSGTVMAALPADLERALKALPFAKSPAGAAPAEPRPERAMPVNEADSRTPASAPGAVPFGSETAALPSPDEVRRLVAAAQPDAAIKAAAERGSGAIAGSRVEPHERRSQREENRTEAIDMDEVRRALVAFESARSDASQPGVAIDTLASIAVAIRSGVPTNVALARHGLTDDAWRSAQAAVVQDPVARARFEHALERIRSAGR